MRTFSRFEDMRFGCAMNLNEDHILSVFPTLATGDNPHSMTGHLYMVRASADVAIFLTDDPYSKIPGYQYQGYAQFS